MGLSPKSWYRSELAISQTRVIVGVLQRTHLQQMMVVDGGGEHLAVVDVVEKQMRRRNGPEVSQTAVETMTTAEPERWVAPRKYRRP